MTKEIGAFDFGPSSANRISFDPAGVVLAVAGGDGTVRLFDTGDRSKCRDVQVYEEASGHSVQSVAWSKSAEHMVTAGSGTVLAN
jgi:WD40 repeat protein